MYVDGKPGDEHCRRVYDHEIPSFLKCHYTEVEMDAFETAAYGKPVELYGGGWEFTPLEIGFEYAEKIVYTQQNVLGVISLEAKSAEPLTPRP